MIQKVFQSQSYDSLLSCQMKNGNSTIDVACSLHEARSNGVTSDISMNTAPALETARTAMPRIIHA